MSTYTHYYRYNQCLYTLLGSNSFTLHCFMYTFLWVVVQWHHHQTVPVSLQFLPHLTLCLDILIDTCCYLTVILIRISCWWKLCFSMWWFIVYFFFTCKLSLSTFYFPVWTALGTTPRGPLHIYSNVNVTKFVDYSTKPIQLHGIAIYLIITHLPMLWNPISKWSPNPLINL